LKELIEKFGFDPDNELHNEFSSLQEERNCCLQILEKELIKNEQIKSQSEEIYRKNIKILQKDCKTLQNKLFHYENENKNLTNLMNQMNIDDLHKEIEIKNEEIAHLKQEIDKQHEENENELIKLKKVLYFL